MTTTDIYTHKITSNGDGSYTLTGAPGWALGPDRSDLGIEEVIRRLGDYDGDRVYRGAPADEIRAWVEYEARKRLQSLDAATINEIVAWIYLTDSEERLRRESTDMLARAMVEAAAYQRGER